LSRTGPDTKKSYPLTSVRFFAAFLVLFHHSVVLLPGFDNRGHHHAPHDFLGVLSFSFSVSVSFFFLLSGYVLSFVYLHTGQVIDKGKFFAARFARLYPLYIVILVLDTPELLLTEIHRHGVSIGLTKTAEIFAANVLMLQAWYPLRLNQINFPSWSLCGEVFFYLCFPLLGVWLWKLQGRRLWLTMLVVYLGGQALFLTAIHHLNPITAFCWPVLHLSTFTLGILLARWQSLRQTRQDKPAERVLWANTVLALSFGGLILSIWLSPFTHVPGLYNNGFLAPLFAGIIWGLSAVSTPLSRWLCGKWLVALGNSSYSLYLIHMSILAIFLHFHWATLWLYPVYLALCIGLGLLSFHYFETPIRLSLVEWFHRRSAKATSRTTSLQAGDLPLNSA
jgi:peptidoglycan/LPS O-acetylase OafA/YrhL